MLSTIEGAVQMCTTALNHHGRPHDQQQPSDASCDAAAAAFGAAITSKGSAVSAAIYLLW